MAVNYTITLTDTEKKCMDTVTDDIDGWISNDLKNRARKAKDIIINNNTRHCNENSIAIAVGEAAQVDQAYSLGLAKTVAQQLIDNAAAEAALRGG
mgnify:FL=1|tara:strand:+ start:902 stop:1189 length:288 start_codon:yes stop_codon:yes gene_type:complete